MKRVALASLTVLFFSVTAFAQMGGPPPGPGPHGGFGRGGPFGPGVAGMHPWKVVTGAPYSAAMTEQSVETLPNNAGTITRSVSGTVARDDRGRTYVQQTFTGGPFGSQSGPKTVIFITDPVGGYSYTLYPDKMLAIQRPFHTPPSGSSDRSNHTHPKDPNVTVQKSTSGNIETTTITRTIPANTIGNTATLTSTSTIQYSSALQIVVVSSRNDPRFGTSSYTLSNITPGDPSNVSFSVPAGYTIQTESGHGHRGPHQ